MDDPKNKPDDEKAKKKLPNIDDEGLIFQEFTEEEKDEIWVAAGRKLPRPKEV